MDVMEQSEALLALILEIQKVYNQLDPVRHDSVRHEIAEGLRRLRAGYSDLLRPGSLKANA